MGFSIQRSVTKEHVKSDIILQRDRSCRRCRKGAKECAFSPNNIDNLTGRVISGVACLPCRRAKAKCELDPPARALDSNRSPPTISSQDPEERHAAAKARESLATNDDPEVLTKISGHSTAAGSKRKQSALESSPSVSHSDRQRVDSDDGPFSTSSQGKKARYATVTKDSDHHMFLLLYRHCAGSEGETKSEPRLNHFSLQYEDALVLLRDYVPRCRAAIAKALVTADVRQTASEGIENAMRWAESFHTKGPLWTCYEPIPGFIRRQLQRVRPLVNENAPIIGIFVDRVEELLKVTNEALELIYGYPT